MMITIKTEYLDTVRRILKAQFNRAECKATDNITLVLAFDSDVLYREVALWLSDAFGCQLIVSYEVARD
jgi:hypothetical protein